MYSTYSTQKNVRSIPCGTLPRHQKVDNDFLKTFNPILFKKKGGTASLNVSFEEVESLINRGGIGKIGGRVCCCYRLL